MDKFLIFDWYSASIDADIELIIASWVAHFPQDCLEPAKAKNGYTHADRFLNPAGDCTVTFMYGGVSQGSKVYCIASGVHSERFAAWVRYFFPDHELVRADVALDFNEFAAWVTLAGWGINLSRLSNIKNRFIGCAGAELLNTPHGDGRTLELGSRSSVGFMRIYEKGKKDNPDLPDWVRAELEFKPKGLQARQAYAKASKLQIINAVKWVSRFFSELGVSVVARPCAAGTLKTLTTHETTIRHLRKQYQKVFLAELELNGGSLEDLGRTLVSVV